MCRCYFCNIPLEDKAVQEDDKSFCSYNCVDNYKESNNTITIHEGYVYPKLYQIGDSEDYKSDLCLCFFDNGCGGLSKEFGYYGKSERMEPIWENTTEDPVRNPTFWCYASSLDSLINSK